MLGNMFAAKNRNHLRRDKIFLIVKNWEDLLQSKSHVKRIMVFIFDMV